MGQETAWYEDPTTLLEEIQRGSRPRPRAPVINGYDEVRELRRGGQGVVYSAVQRSTKRRVAIKVLYEDATAGELRRRRFEREVDLVAGLRHPYIVSVYDSGVTADGRLYLVMEYVEGEPFQQWIANCPGATEAVLRLFARICDAVHYAHQRGVIHRDLKPSNILVVDVGAVSGRDSCTSRSETAPSAQPKVLDFGVAKLTTPAADAPMTLTGHFVGTLSYASPEQLQGDPSAIDVRTDVYALGVMLYEALAGRHPYPAQGSIAGLIKAVEQSDPPPPSQAVAREGGQVERRVWEGRCLDAELDALVLKALKKDPAGRYQSVAALRDDIERYLTGRPLDARRDSGWYVFSKTLRRYRLPAAAAAAFLVLIIAFGVAMSVQYRRARIEADKANQIRVFLEDTLGSVEPARPGHDVTVRETLDEAVHWVELALGGQPEVAASLRTTIGNSYRSLGLHAAAEQQLNLGLAARRRLFGDEHSQVAQSLNALGMLFRDRGDLTAAEEHFRRALAMRRKLLGDKHVDVAMTLQNLAGVLQSRGRYDAAARALQEAWDTQRERLGDRHPDVAMCQFRLAEVKEAEGNFEAAEALHARALALRRAALPRDHPDLARSLMGLGRVLLRRGDAARAEPLLRECVEIGESATPVNPARQAEARRLLTECLAALGRHAEAAEFRSPPTGR